MDIFSQYPEILNKFKELSQTRRNEIIQILVDKDSNYDMLRRKRTDASMALRNALKDRVVLLETYTDAVFAQECYELDELYRQGFMDALNVLEEQGALQNR